MAEIVLEEGIWDKDQLKKNEDEDKALRPTQWGAIQTDTYKALSVTRQRLSPGAYTITRDMNDGQPIFVKKDIVADKGLVSEGLSAKIITEIKDFWKKGDLFKKHGFLHSRGYLLYGSAGVGKTSIVHQIMQDIIADGGIVFICGNPTFFMSGLKVFRQTEPERKAVCVFEDIDAIIKKYGDDDLLSILDGANQVNSVLNIATTNYPETLDKRIINRPRRFDRVYKIEAPGEAIRRAYLKSKLPKGQSLERWIKKTNGVSFAGLAEALISVLCLGNELDDTIKVLTDLEGGHPSSQDFGQIGFGGGESDLSTNTSDRPSRAGGRGSVEEGMRLPPPIPVNEFGD